MGNTEVSVKVTAHVHLDTKEAREIPLQAEWMKTPTEVTKAVLRYTYEGELRGWCLSGGTQFFHRVKKDGSPYKDEQDCPIWPNRVPLEVLRKYAPTSLPVVSWVGNE